MTFLLSLAALLYPHHKPKEVDTIRESAVRVPAARPVVTPAPIKPTPRPTVRPTPQPRPKAVPVVTRITDVEPNCARVLAAWPGDDAWALRNARRESGCDPKAYTPAGEEGPNAYYGVWQFDLSTWHSNGGEGIPTDHSIEYQTHIAWLTYQRRGCEPWGCR